MSTGPLIRTVEARVALRCVIPGPRWRIPDDLVPGRGDRPRDPRCRPPGCRPSRSAMPNRRSRGPWSHPFAAVAPRSSNGLR